VNKRILILVAIAVPAFFLQGKQTTPPPTPFNCPVTIQILDYLNGPQITDACWGVDDATLQVATNSGNLLGSGCQVLWDYSTDGGLTWPSLGQGNPFNTNPISLISGLSCTNPSFVLEFRATVNGSCNNLPPNWQPSCILTVNLNVWCPTNPGTIDIQQSGQSVTAICSNGTYPVPVTLNLTNQVGTVDYWTDNGVMIAGSTGQTSINYQITYPGVHWFCAFVHNGSCNKAPLSTCKPVTVEDPIKGSILVTQNGVPNPSPEVCWGDDKVTMTFVPNPPLPPGATILWEYQIDCTGPWISSGNSGTTQNSNDVVLTPFYSSGNPCTTHQVCWRVKGRAPAGICGDSYISLNQAGSATTIYVINPFNHTNPPVIAPATPAVKCPGQQVALTAQNYNNCATGPFTFEWFLNGISVSGPTNNPSFNAIDPGNYTVKICNKNNCDCIETAPVTVRDCLTVVTLNASACACKPGQTITLTANVSSHVVPAGGSSSNCSGPYTYSWSTGATGQSITVQCPTGTTTYTVTVKDALNCTTTASYTLKRCP
jgi:hypothetical protein